VLLRSAVVSNTPILLDDWYQLTYWRHHDFGLAAIWEYGHYNYFHFNPRIGDVFLAIVNGPRAVHLIVTPLMQLAVLPITYVIANNRGYRIIKERLVSFRKTDKFTGMDIREPDIDYVALGASLGLKSTRVTDPHDLAPALRAAFASGGPNLVDVRVADGFGG